jgi:hypothetical protein
MIATLLIARLRSAWRRWVPTMIALALGIAVPIVARAAGTATADEAFRRGLDALPTEDRIVTAATYDQPGETLPDDLDATVRAELARLGGDDPVHVLAYRPLADSRGGTVQLAAADELARYVTLIDGRLPERCDPDRCEVVQLAERRPVDELPDSLGVVVVGTVSRDEPLLLAGTFEADPDVGVLLADGVASLDRLASLELFGRSQGWLTDVDVRTLRDVGVDRWVARSRAGANALIAEPWDVGLTAPDDVLATEVARARRSADRFLLLGSALAVLLLGAAVVAGTAMRADHQGFAGVLRRRGTPRRRIMAVTLAEAGAVVGAGAVLGSALGIAVGWVIGTRVGLPPAEVAFGAWSAALPSCLVAALVSVALIVVAVSYGGRRRGVWPLVDAGLAACAAVVVLVLASELRPVPDRSATTLAMLPAVVLVAGGLATARLWPWAAIGLARVLRRGPVTARVGVSGAAGRPMRPAASAALLAAAVGATVFAVAYRETLARGAADQAAEAVPLDARVTTGAALDRPLDLVVPGSGAVPDGARAWPVHRVAASVRVTTERGEVVQMLGVDPAMLADVDRWSATVGALSGAEVADRIAIDPLPPAPAMPLGVAIEIDIDGSESAVAMSAAVRASDGRVRIVKLRSEPEGVFEGPRTLVGELPELPGADSVELVAFSAAESSEVAASLRQHNLGEGDSDRISAATSIVLGAVRVDGSEVATPWDGWGSLQPGPDGYRWDVVMAANRVTISPRPTGPGEVGDPLPVAVDPRTAASVGGEGGELILVLNGRSVTSEVTSVLDEFPTTRGRFAVVDRAALSRLIDVTQPESGQPGELWVDYGDDGGGRSGGALDDPIFERLTVTSQAEIERLVRTDPVGRSAVGLLLGVAAMTMLLAVLLFVLFVVTERHDDAAPALAWEAEGVTPSNLRRALVWRSLAVVGPALPLGLASGLLLAQLTARMVAVTASATVPKPALVAGAGTWVGLFAAGLAVAGALGAACVVAARAWREPLPVRVSEGLE